MCGIAGIVGKSISKDQNRSALDGMMRALRHRGPDDEGIWISASETAGFTATRLAILDLSPAGHQPMSTDDGRYTIAFNGEIYNYSALRAQLSDHGYQFKSKGDTEVVLQAFLQFGPSCVEKFRGMFAFAIWDDQKKSCFLARDPFGIKPIYFHHDQNRQRLIFASELRALLASQLVPRKLSADGLFGYFRYGSVQEPDTMLQDVRSLPAGSTLQFSEGKISTNCYWRATFSEAQAKATYDETAAPKIVRNALIDSIRAHFVSDVPVGIFLSGGIDSTAVAIAARAAQESADLRTFSIGVDDPNLNESSLARQTAELLKTDHCESCLDATRARELFNDFLNHIDQPSVDGFNTFAVSQFAHEKGLKVILSGLGGDELFAGYPTFRNVPRLLRANLALGGTNSLRRNAVQSILSRANAPRYRRLRSFLQKPTGLGEAYNAWRGIFTSDEAQNLVSAITDQKISELCLTEMNAQDADLANAISQMELERYMRNQLLRDSDVMSMACSLELRVPFVDRVLFEKVRGISSAIRLRPGKKLLLEAMPEIPAWIRTQAKRGFAFPFAKWGVAEWFGGEKLRTRFNLSPHTSWYQLWCLFVFENWWHRINQRAA